MEKWRLKLTSANIEVEVEAELDNLVFEIVGSMAPLHCHVNSRWVVHHSL